MLCHGSVFAGCGPFHPLHIHGGLCVDVLSHIFFVLEDNNVQSDAAVVPSDSDAFNDVRFAIGIIPSAFGKMLRTKIALRDTIARHFNRALFVTLTSYA